jgi:hypothetical protein
MILFNCLKLFLLLENEALQLFQHRGLSSREAEEPRRKKADVPDSITTPAMTLSGQGNKTSIYKLKQKIIHSRPGSPFKFQGEIHGCQRDP